MSSHTYCVGPVGIGAWTVHRRPSWASFGHYEDTPWKWFDRHKGEDLNKGWQSNRYLLCHRYIRLPGRSQDHRLNPSTNWSDHPESETEPIPLLRTSPRTNRNWLPLLELLQSSFTAKFQIDPILLMILSHIYMQKKRNTKKNLIFSKENPSLVNTCCN